MHLNEFYIWSKRSIAFSSDMLVTIVAWISANWLTSNSIIHDINLKLFLTIIAVQYTVYIICGLYRGIWRFASIPDLIRILRAVLIGTAANLIFFTATGIDFSVKIYFIYTIFLITLLSGSRVLFRWSREYNKIMQKGKRVLVVGAGSAGEGLIRDLHRSRSLHSYIPVAFVDDDPMRQGCEVQGIRVVGRCDEIPNLIKLYDIELILIAIPSATTKRMREIVQYCIDAKIAYQTLPGIKDIANGVVKISSLREVQLEDLLEREQIEHDWENVKTFIQNKIILVTGGGGSIGSELCRQISHLNPKKIIIVDNNEFNLYSINLELEKKFAKEKIFSYLFSVTDKLAIQKVFDVHTPDLVFHVAAYKHVPLLETHIRVSMHNNIIGTKIVAELSEKNKVDTFVLISTDKAVNPTSLMGATKRAAEIFCQTLNLHSSTRYITVRFGNVLDSAGSVIPLFRKQLLSGGPLTVTHPKISRYFMTIPEAAQLILQAMIIKNEGEIFVLDMGEPIYIQYLAEQMIKLSGKKIGEDIEIIYTGLRPGEKLYEELFHDNENICKTSHPKIKQAKIRPYDQMKLLSIIAEIETAYLYYDEMKLKNLLYELVPEYKEHKNSTATQSERTIENYLENSLSYT